MKLMNSLHAAPQGPARKTPGSPSISRATRLSSAMSASAPPGIHGSPRPASAVGLRGRPVARSSVVGSRTRRPARRTTGRNGSSRPRRSCPWMTHRGFLSKKASREKERLTANRARARPPSRSRRAARSPCERGSPRPARPSPCRETTGPCRSPGMPRGAQTSTRSWGSTASRCLGRGSRGFGPSESGRRRTRPTSAARSTTRASSSAWAGAPAPRRGLSAQGGRGSA